MFVFFARIQRKMHSPCALISLCPLLSVFVQDPKRANLLNFCLYNGKMWKAIFVKLRKHFMDIENFLHSKSIVVPSQGPEAEAR